MLYNFSTCAPGWFSKTFSPRKSLNGSKLDEIWELEDEENTYRMNFHEESDSELKTCKFRVFFVGNIFLTKKHRSIFLYFQTENHKIDLPLLGELGQTSRDPWRIGSESSESRDVWPNSFKSGFLIFSFSYDFFSFCEFLKSLMKSKKWKSHFWRN